jgi:hypothetical protein
LYNIGRIRASTAPHTNGNRQYHCHRKQQWHNKTKCTKAMEMRFYWIKDRVKQGQFNVYWGPGYQNFADYFTKHHSPAHHKRMREIYIHADEQPIIGEEFEIPHCEGVLIPQVSPAHKYPISPLGDDSSPRGDIMQ